MKASVNGASARSRSVANVFARATNALSTTPGRVAMRKSNATTQGVPPTCAANTTVSLSGAQTAIGSA